MKRGITRGKPLTCASERLSRDNETMSNKPLNDTIQKDGQQESWAEYQVRISAPGYQTPIISSDNSPFTPAEYLLGFLVELEKSLPPAEVCSDQLTKALQALLRIATALETIAGNSFDIQRLGDTDDDD